MNEGCDKQFTENLVKWANAIRKTFYDGGVDEIITTRRLVHIVQANSIFNDRIKAVTTCINRFDEDTKMSSLISTLKWMQVKTVWRAKIS